METNGFNATTAKIASINQLPESSQVKDGTPIKLLTQNLSDLAGVSITIGAPKGQDLINELNGYQGFQYDEIKGRSSDARIYQDKQTVFDGSDPYNPAYFEVASVFYQDLTKEEHEKLVAKIMGNKLNPTANYNYFREGQNSGSLSMQYGITDFDWKAMRGMAEEYTDTVNGAKNAALNNDIARHEFNAEGTVVTNSGNEVEFSLTYREENRLPSYISISTGSETSEEFEKRIHEKWLNTRDGGIQSEEDYRAINFTFKSANPLSKEDVNALDILARKIMETANQASQGIMDTAYYDLASQFHGIESLFKSVEINATYDGAALGHTDYKVDLLSNSLNTKLNIDEDNRDYNVKRFWN